MQFHLLYIYKRKNKSITAEDNRHIKWEGTLPLVTVQLPIFNEKYVVERLIDNIIALDYPKDRLEIQVLDDSTDNTLEISKRKVEEYQKLGYQIVLVHRKDRSGYKAGALKEGMKTAKGDYIAIFDADFLPRPEFLQKTIPHFNDPMVGVVQTRWEHINQNYSLITQLQAFQLNVHFTVEQSGREAGKYMLQFNGTGGIWRKSTISDAGGWEADTLTEDLDLSYRAQLKGWTIKYLENLGSPAELPAEMNGLKSQQHRWMKGGAETAKKILPSVWRSNLSFMKKIHASLHLLASGIFVFVFVIGVFSVPVLFMLEPLGINVSYFAFCLTGLLSIMIVYYVANVQVAWEKQKPIKMIWKFVVLFPMFLALSMGLSLHNSIAVFQGWLGKKSPFVRTPKFNIQELKGTFKNRSYLTDRIPLTTIAEGVLSLYFIVAIVFSIITSDTSFIFFHLLLAMGFGAICYYSIKHLNY
jgi:cellulose synthase/poly-beta-1,6-N-acetylglucosamine synthase-like glycosyltransferase